MGRLAQLIQHDIVGGHEMLEGLTYVYMLPSAPNSRSNLLLQLAVMSEASVR